MDRGLTLRDVEKTTDISNAYLSQLENGRADQPSPRILHKLAGFYDFPYTELMIAAGYLQPKGNAQSAKLEGLDALLLSSDLNEDDAKTVKLFIEVLRQRRKMESATTDEK
jgi:transcriptional regulator with XRE-family HTH domain